MNVQFGLVFDMDGVIVNSNPVHKEVIKLFCEKHERAVSDDFLKQRVYGRTNKEWIPEVFGRLPDAEVEQYANEKEQMFRDMFDPQEAEVPGLTQFLKNLNREQIPCVVATSAPKANADYILSELNISEYFLTVLDSSHVDKGKPEPEIYLKAASKLNMSPDNCIVFEDSLAGVEAALRAGTLVIGVTSTHSASELENCHLIIDNFLDLSIGDLQKTFLKE
jgi:beta-phosphoglucomutase